MSVQSQVNEEAFQLIGPVYLSSSFHGSSPLKALSEQLAELSAHAKGVEDAFAGAQNEAQEKLAARKADAVAAVKRAVERVNQQIKSAGENATKD